MQVANIECQIANAQLRRYLTGEEMPSSVVNELETHLRNCPECMSAAQTLRESLKGVLSSKITGKPAPQPKAPTSAQPQIQVLDQAIVTERVETPRPADVFDAPDSEFKQTAPKKKSNVKTLVYSIGLAAILVLMSTVFKDPTALFGPKASSITPDTPKESKTSETTTTTPPATTSTEEVDTTPTDPVTTDPVATGPVTTPAGTEATAKPPLKTDGLIVADGNTGTTVVKNDPPKAEPKPKPQAPRKSAPKKQASDPGVGTIKVYPPDK